VAVGAVYAPHTVAAATLPVGVRPPHLFFASSGAVGGGVAGMVGGLGHGVSLS
jgi:hypothetical protein